MSETPIASISFFSCRAAKSRARAWASRVVRDKAALAVLPEISTDLILYEKFRKNRENISLIASEMSSPAAASGKRSAADRYPEAVSGSRVLKSSSSLVMTLRTFALSEIPQPRHKTATMMIRQKRKRCTGFISSFPFLCFVRGYLLFYF